MNISMNMSSYEVEAGVSVEPEYSEEVMYAGWNPDIDHLLICQQQSHIQAAARTSLPLDLTMEDAEQFLQNMYAYQC